MRSVLADTGPLVALLDRREASHSRCVDFTRAHDSPLLTTWPVLTEAAWLLRRNPRNVENLLARIEDGTLEVFPLDEIAAIWIRSFLTRYRDLGPQVADASLMYVAESLDLTEVFTLDRRDFSAFRREDGRAMTLFPE